MINVTAATRFIGKSAKGLAKGLSTYGPTVATAIFVASAVVDLGESIMNLARNNAPAHTEAPVDNATESVEIPEIIE